MTVPDAFPNRRHIMTVCIGLMLLKNSFTTFDRWLRFGLFGAVISGLATS